MTTRTSPRKKKVATAWPNPYLAWGSLVAVLALVAYMAWEIFGNQNNWTKIERIGIRVPMKYQVHGIDVSHHQSVINWQKVKRMQTEGLKIDFVYLKATEGASHLDKQFQRNWEETKRLGLRRGAYHFFIPWTDPVKQANLFVATAKLQPGDLPPVLDFERASLRPPEKVIRDLNIWLNLVEKRYGVKPIIYVNPDFYRRFIKGNFDEYPLWIADYSNKNLEGYPSDKLLFWQHSRAGWVDGVNEKVDFNVFFESIEELEDLCLKN